LKVEIPKNKFDQPGAGEKGRKIEKGRQYSAIGEGGKGKDRKFVRRNCGP